MDGIVSNSITTANRFGDWMAGCRNALPAIVCHAILRVKNAVENQLLMVPLDVRVAGRWYLGVILKLRNALGGGVGHVLHFVTWGGGNASVT